MKVKDITMQIVKNLGNYETVRLEATYILDDSDDEDLTHCFEVAKMELENAYKSLYTKPKTEAPKQEVHQKLTMTMTHPQFEGICKALHEGRADLALVQKHYILSKEVFNYFQKHKLI